MISKHMPVVQCAFEEVTAELTLDNQKLLKCFVQVGHGSLNLVSWKFRTKNCSRAFVTWCMCSEHSGVLPKLYLQFEQDLFI